MTNVEEKLEAHKKTVDELKNDIFKFKVYISAIVFVAAIFGFTLFNTWNKIKEIESGVGEHLALIKDAKNTAITNIKNTTKDEIVSIKNELNTAKSEIYSSLEKLNVPIGTILSFAGPKTKIPENWMICDGRKLKVSEF